jgi:translocation and assembly module TamB
MSEADALSYLVIGRPLAQASDTEGDQLSTTAVSLGIRQAARITQEIGRSIGLDELTIIGGGGDATALVAGKQVNSRLYARYAYGVFSRLGMILIRYKLTENLSLEAGAGEAQSIDILYSIDKE